MKAIVKATGEIIEISDDCSYIYAEHYDKQYDLSELEFVQGPMRMEIFPDYWTRLEHQYAGMAMQTMLATLYNPKYHKELMACYTEVDAKEVARLSKYYAHALILKLKEKEE